MTKVQSASWNKTLCHKHVILRLLDWKELAVPWETMLFRPTIFHEEPSVKYAHGCLCPSRAHLAPNPGIPCTPRKLRHALNSDNTWVNIKSTKSYTYLCWHRLRSFPALIAKLNSCIQELYAIYNLLNLFTNDFLALNPENYVSGMWIYSWRK